ncbi:MAG: flagellar assembly protein FliH [Synergistaceae bacterium]|nr:flagellar assembly protein FliH [Synergistaceae bacterium]
MSDFLRPNVLRAVRILSETVKVGSSLSADESEREVQPASRTVLPRDPLALLKEELALTQSRLERAEVEITLLSSRNRVLAEQFQAERKKAEEEEQQRRAILEAEGTDLRKRSVEEGFLEGKRTGCAEGQEQARREMKRHYEGKVASLVVLLENVHATLSKRLEGLAALHLPQLIRMWELLLSRMLQQEVTLREDTAMLVLREVLERVSDRERILVYLNADDLEGILGRKDSFGDLLRGVKYLEYLSDANVEKGSCIVETNLGIYDARWRTQLEQIGKDIDHLFIEGRNDDAETS